MPNSNQSEASAANQSDTKSQFSKLLSGIQEEGSEKGQTANQQSSGQGVPLSADEQQKAQAVEQQIQSFEQQLESKSNSELKQISTQLETVERSMLLEKIDNQLHTMKDTIVKPGDGASPAAAGAAAATAVAINQPTETTTI